MEKYPDFCFCQSSAQYYKWLEERFPETFEELKKRIKEGRWEIVGGTWVESDGNIPSGESFVRQFLYGKRYFKKKFGVNVKIAWMPDSFGYAWTLPQIMKKSGMRFFLTQKMNWNDTTIFPYYFFKWSAPDGSSIFAHQTVGGYSEQIMGRDILRQLWILKWRQKISDLLVLFGMGDHGGGVTEEMIKRAQSFIKGKDLVKGRFSTVKEYFNILTEKFKEMELPEINDELYLQYHRGTYTTQARVKKNNRKAECLLEVAEKFSTIAKLYDLEYPSKELTECWEKLLLNQFHDVLPGSSIPGVYEDSEKDFKFIFEVTESAISKSIKKIASKVDTTGEGISILVFNSLSWRRDGKVVVPLEELGNQGEIEIYDDQGRMIPYQIIDGKKLLFIAEGVPPIGYKEYKAIKVDKKSVFSTDLSSEETENTIILENQFFKIIVDKETGLLSSIYDKRNGKEVLREYGNKIQIYEDYPQTGRSSVMFPMDAVVFDAWEIYIYQQPEGVKHVELKQPTEVRLVDKGPVKVSVSVQYKYVQEGRPDSTFSVEIILYNNIPILEFNLHVDWHAEHRLSKVAFPLNVDNEFTAYEIPYGFIMRRNPLSPNATLSERAKYEVPGQKWIDHTDRDGSYGVSLLNDCKYGFDTINNIMRMTLLRSARHPRAYHAREDVETELTDQGEHHIAYALYPHRSDFKEALTARKGYEFNYPLIHLVESSHNGELPKVHSFLSAEPENIILTTIKKAEDSDETILRFYETSGKDTKVSIHLDRCPVIAKETNLMEEEESELPISGKTIEVPIGKHEIKTVKVLF